jgi:hypothetical protein
VAADDVHAAAEAIMPINSIQFQPGLSMFAFIERYGTEEKCEAAIAAARWPDGYVCPRCRGTSALSFRRGRQSFRECRGCRYQCSLIVGTMFEGTKVALTRWFPAMQCSARPRTTSPPWNCGASWACRTPLPGS